MGDRLGLRGSRLCRGVGCGGGLHCGAGVSITRRDRASRPCLEEPAVGMGLRRLSGALLQLTCAELHWTCPWALTSKLLPAGLVPNSCFTAPPHPTPQAAEDADRRREEKEREAQRKLEAERRAAEQRQRQVGLAGQGWLVGLAGQGRLAGGRA